MKKHLLAVGLLSVILLSAAERTVTNAWVIRCPEPANITEKYAVEQLQKYIAAATGMKLKTASSGSPALILQTDPALGREEWSVTAEKSGDLLIRGGHPVGVLYGVYEFLEKVIGCRFLAPDAEYVPKRKQLRFDSGLKLQGKPFFTRREIYLLTAVMNRHTEYLGKLRLSGTRIFGTYIDPYRFGSTGNTHSFHRLSKDFPKDKPEYFSLDKSGKRLRSVSGLGPGQLCLTHPDVRRLVTEKLLEMIRTDRANAGSQPPPVIYSLCKNDNQDDCVCKNCLALERKYHGNHAGVYLDFASDIARRIAKIHPDVLIRISAYTTDENPVPGIRLPENILMGIAQLGSEFKTRVKRDSMRGLDHQNNVRAGEMLRKWKAACSRMMTWDYWVLYRQQYPAPVVNLQAIITNLRFYAKLGLRYVFAESETAPEYQTAFLDLRHYIGAKLLLDPDADEKALTAEFMKLYYGPAAKAMTAYLEYLERRMREETLPVGSVPPNARAYMDKPFFIETEKILSKAEKVAAGTPQYLARIGQERILTDLALLQMGKRRGVDFDKKTVIARLKKNYAAYIAKYADAELGKIWKNRTDELIDSYAGQPPLPERFANRRAFDFWGPKLKVNNTVVRKIDDPDAVTGKALALFDLNAIKKDNPDFHRKNPVFSLYDNLSKKTLLRKTLKPDQYPQDEKYHWYYLGKTRLSAKNLLIFHWSWWLSQDVGSSVFDPLEPNAEYDVHVSVKLTGPAYVKKSKSADSIRLDRIVFLEAGK